MKIGINLIILYSLYFYVLIYSHFHGTLFVWSDSLALRTENWSRLLNSWCWMCLKSLLLILHYSSLCCMDPLLSCSLCPSLSCSLCLSAIGHKSKVTTCCHMIVCIMQWQLIIIYQLDFIQVFIQSVTKQRMFVTLDGEYKIFWLNLSERLGRPLRLE